MKLTEILKGIMGNEDASAAELRVALYSVDVAFREDKVLAAEKARAAILLNDTDDELDKADEALKAAIRERDRAKVGHAEISRRLAEAEVAEAAAALDAARAAVEKEAEFVAKLLAEKWTKAQAEMVLILRRLIGAEKAVEDMNARLAAAGRDDAIAPVETRAFPSPEYELASLHSIARLTSFRELPGAPGWR